MDIRPLLERLDLRELAEEAGARFRGRGNSSPCPLHGGKNPSAFHLYKGAGDRLRWHCFTNCPKDANDGDALSFYMRWRKVDFRTAVAELARRYGVYVVLGGQAEQAATPAPEPVTPGATWTARGLAFVAYSQEQLHKRGDLIEYLALERGLSPEALDVWRIGYNPTDVRDSAARWGIADDKPVWCARGIVIPTLIGGEPVFINVRRPLPGDSLAKLIGPVSGLKGVKYAGVRGGIRRLFGVDLLRGAEFLVLCEGEFDALCLWTAAGDLVDAATIGGARQRLRIEDAVYLLRCRRILAAYDTDEAGEAGRLQLAALSERVATISPASAHDVTDLWRVGGALGLRKWLRGGMDGADRVDHGAGDRGGADVSGGGGDRGRTAGGEG